MKKDKVKASLEDILKILKQERKHSQKFNSLNKFLKLWKIKLPSLKKILRKKMQKSKNFKTLHN